jgi:hypothetical protein
MIATKRKLQLDKTTLRALSKAHLGHVVGGIQDTDELVTAAPCHGHGTTIPPYTSQPGCHEPPPPPSPLTGSLPPRPPLEP